MMTFIKQFVRKLSAALLLAMLSAPGPTAYAAEVTIDAEVYDATDNQWGFQHEQTVVFVNDQTGYAFFVDNGGIVAYRKTTNGGSSWGSAVNLTAQTDCRGIMVWYDRWTPGDYTGNYIHIAFQEVGGDDVYYERLDTSDDSQLGETNVSGAQGGIVGLRNRFSITKSTDNTLYIAMINSADSYVMECSTSCGSSGNWSETGTNPFVNQDEDHVLLLPLADGDVLAINWDVGADTIQHKIWDDSLGAWEGSFTDIDINAIYNNTYQSAWSATVDRTNNDIYLCYNNDVTSATGDIVTAIFDGTSWTTKTNMATNDASLQCAIALDENTGDVYVARMDVGTLGSSHSAFYAKSTDGMSSWSSETDLTTSDANHQSLTMNLMSNERLYATWYDDDDLDIFGETVTDLSAPSISGTSNLPNGTTVRFAVNDTLRAETTTVSGGAWTISSVILKEYDSVVVWADGVADADESTAVAFYSGTGDLTGLVLNRHELSVGSDKNETQILLDFSLYDNDQDEDIMHTSNSNVLTVDADDAYADDKIVFLSGNTLNFNLGNTLIAHDVEINGVLNSTSSGVINVSGSWDNNNDFNSFQETVNFTAESGSETIDSTGAVDAGFYNVVFDDSGGSATWVLESVLDVDNNLTISGGALDVKTGENNGITVGGDWTNSDTFTARNGLVTFDATSGSNDIVSGGSSFYEIKFDDGGGGATFVLEDTLDVDGDLTITGGTVDTKVGENNTINLAGNWSNSDTFTARSGMVNLNGVNQSISGSNTFFKLQKIETSNDGIDSTLTFDNGGTQTITGPLVLQGLDADDLINLRSDSALDWDLDPQGSRVISYLDVKNSNNTNAAIIYCATGCVDSGSNSKWVFGSEPSAANFRVTTYELQDAEFTGTTYTLTLNNNLESNYFAMVAGPSDDTNARGAGDDGVRVSGDPFSNLGTTTSANQIELTRGNSTFDWIGAVTIVECLAACTTSGFELKEVREVAMAQLTTNTTLQTVTDTLSSSHTAQTVPFGAKWGGGAATQGTEDDLNEYGVILGVRIYKSSTNQITLERYTARGQDAEAIDVTVYIVEWGSEWNVEEINFVDWDAGGPSADATGEYTTTALSGSVTRANTWVWKSPGTSEEDGLGDGPFGKVVTLGDGVNQNATESVVALGSEHSGGPFDIRRDTVYVLEHPDVAVDYRFVADGSAGPSSGYQSLNQAIDAANGDESYDNSASDVRWTEGQRFGMLWATNNGVGQQYSRTGGWTARVNDDENLLIWRAYAGQNHTDWIQVIDFAGNTSEQFDVSGISDLADGTSVKFAINGTVQAVTGTISSGAWTIADITQPAAGDIITVWADGVTDANESTAITKYDGSGDIAGLVLDKHVLTVGGDDNQSITINELTGQYDNSDDEDIMYLISSGTLRVDDDNVYSDDKLVILSGDSLSIDGTQGVDGHDMSIAGTLSVTGTASFIFSGSWDNNGLFVPANSTIKMTSTNAETFDPGTNTIYNLTFDGVAGSWVLQDDLDVNGTFTIANGTVDANSGQNYNINIAGNWNNQGTYTARNGIVTFDGGDQNISGSTAFYDLVKMETVDDATEFTVVFEEGETQTVTNTWTWCGLDSDDKIIIKSSNPGVGNDWFVDPQGARAVFFLDVENSNNTNTTTVDCTNGCVDNGDNTNWNFTANTITISGTVYVDEGVTDIGAGTNVRLAVNGVSDNADTTDANGAFSITSSGGVGAGAVLTLYLDTGGGDAGVTVSRSDGNDISDLDIYRDYLIVRSEDGISTNNINLNTANNNGDADIDAIYTVPSGNTVQVVNGKELFVPAGNEYNPQANLEIGSSGASSVLDIDGTLTMEAANTLTVRGPLDVSGVFTGASGDIDVDGDLTISAGSFTSTTGSLTVGGTIDMAAATFAGNDGELVLDGTTQQTVSAGANTLHKILVTNATAPGVIFDEAFTTAHFKNNTANSKMTFQGGVTFNITETIMLTGASGQLIALDSTDSNRFTFNVTGGTQAVSYVSVSNSEVSGSSITANNSSAGLNTDALETIPRWFFPQPVDLSIKTGRFTMTTGTGNISVSDVGFQPKAYVLFITKNAVDGDDSAEGAGNGSLLAIGMTDGTNQFCMASGAEDNQTTTDVGRRGFETAGAGNAVACNINVANNAQSDLGRAVHVSMDAGGFTINRTTAFTNPTDVLVEYIAFGGADLSVHVNNVNLADSQDASVDETSPGFEPDVLMTSFIGYFDDASVASNDASSISLGWAINPTIQASDNQHSIMTASRDAQGAGATVTRFDDTLAGTSYLNGAIETAFEIENFDASGFDVTTRLGAAAGEEIMGYLALKFGSNPLVFAVNTTASINTGKVGELGARFEPIFLMGIGSAVAVTGSLDTSGGSMVVGITDGTNTYSLATHDEDAANPTNTHSKTTDQSFLKAYKQDQTADFNVEFTSFDPNGWTVDYQKKAKQAYQMGFLAIGINAAPITVTGTAYIDEGVTNIGAGKTVAVVINGSTPAQTDETDANGAFDFSIQASAGDILTFYLEDEPENGVVVTVSDGNSITDMQLFQDYLIIDNHNAAVTTNADLAVADNTLDADITAIYTMVNDELTVGDGVELYIPTGITFAPGDKVSADNVDINGVFTMGAADMTVSGTLDATGGSFTSMGQVTFDATSAVGIISNTSSFNDVTFNGSTGTWVLQDALDVDGDLTITSGTLDVNASGNYDVLVGGNWTNNANFLPRSGLVTLNASSGDLTLTSGGAAFYDITLSPNVGTASYTLQDALDVNGTLTIDNGILDVNAAGDYNITVAGNWINNSTFTARNGLVIFDGGDQSILGTNIFYDLLKTETSDDATDVTLTFEGNKTLTVLGAWTLTGLDSDDQINLVSDGVIRWRVVPQGVRAISYLDVTKSNNVSGSTVDCTNGCTDSGSNIDWNFTAGIITVSGTVYIDEGVTEIGAGTTVRLVVNGVADNTDITSVNGTFSITSGVAVGAGAVITLYLDTDGGDSGVAVSLADGSDITDMDVYKDYLITRSDNGGALTNINLDTANNNGDTDIDAIYTMAGTVVTLVNGKELFVKAGHGYSPGDGLSIGTSGNTSALDINGTFTMSTGGTLTIYGTLDSAGVFNGSSGIIDVNGDLNSSAGTFTSTSATMTVSGTIDLAAGTYVHNSGSVTLDGTQQQTLSAGSNTFGALTIANDTAAGVIFDEAFTTGDFTNITVNSNMTFQHNTTFTITGDLTLSGAISNEIVLKSADGVNRFTFDITGGPQTVAFVDVSDSQTSTNNITATNSIDQNNTDSGEGAPHWIFATPADLQIAVGRFTLTGGTGDLDVTDVGFTPSAYIIILTKNDTDDADSAEGTGNGSILSIGMTDGTRQFCMGSGVEDAQGSMDVGRRGFEVGNVGDEVVCNFAVGDTQTVQGEASHAAFLVNGFRINRGVAFSNPSNVFAQYIAFGGADLSVYTDLVDLSNGVNTDVDVTAPNFAPDLVLTSFIGYYQDADTDGNNDDDSISFGWAVSGTLQSSNDQFSIMKASRDAVADGQVFTRFDANWAGTSIRDAALDVSYELGTFDSQGFTVTTRQTGAAANELMGYMALNVGPNPQVYSTSRAAKTSIGSDVEENARFEPIFLIGIGSAVANVPDTNVSGGSLTLGITDGTNSYSMSVHDQDGSGSSNTHSRTTQNQFMKVYNQDGTIDRVVSLTSFDTNGWTLDYTDAAGAAYNNAFLAIGTSPAAQTILGTVYTDEGVTNIGAGKSVAISINGDVPAQTTTTGTLGQFDFTVVASAGDVLTVYLDDETEQAVAVTVTDGGLIPDFDLYQNRLIIRNDNGGSTTNVDLATADNNADADITDLYTMAGNSLTVADGIELFIDAGGTYAPGDLVTADDMDINGVFAMAANTITVSGSFDATGGTFTTTGKVVFDANVTSRTITSAGNSFHAITFNGSGGTWILEDALDVNDDLTITTGTLDVNSTENNGINVAGNWTVTGSFLAQTGTVTFDAASVVTKDISPGAESFYNIVFDDAGGGATFELEGTLDVNGTLTLSGGTLDTKAGFNYPVSVAGYWINDDTFMAQSGTVTFDAATGSPTIGGAGGSFYHIEFNDAGNNITWTLADNIDVNGDLTITGGTVDVNAAENNQITLAGNWENNDTFTAQNGTVIFDAPSGAAIITSNATIFYNVQFNDGGGGATFELQDALDVNGTLSLTAGNLDVMSGVNSSIHVAGNWIGGGMLTAQTGTITFDATAGAPTITSAGTDFYNIAFDDAGNNITFTLEDALDVNGTLSIVGGNLDTKSGESNTINVAGNWINGDLFTAQNSTVVLDATSGSATVTSGGQAFYNLNINDAGSNINFVLQDALDVNGTLLITSGTLDVNAGGNYQITVAGNWNSADTFLARTGTLIFDATAGTPTVTSNGQAVNNIDFDDAGNGITFTLEDALDVNGTLRINGGTLDVKSGEDNNIHVAGDWINNDMFVARNGGVVLDGGDQTILGSTTFYDFTKTDTVNDSVELSVTFDVNGSIGIDGAWAFTGIDSDDQIVLQPSVPGNHWYVNPQGARLLSFLDVTYSNNVSGTTVNCTNGCTDSTNNIDWNFTAGILTIAGTVYIDEGVTNIGAGTTVQLAINGANDNTDVTDANGAFSITTGVAVGAGAVLTLYLDTGGGDAGVTVALSSGTDSTDQYIYRDYLVVRTDSGAAIANTHLDTANNTGDADIDAIYTMAGTELTVINGKELLIDETSEYAPGANVNIGSSGETTTLDVQGALTLDAGDTLTVRGTLDSSGIVFGSSSMIDINGTLLTTSGTFTATRGSMTVSGTISLASGTFVHNSGSVVLDGTQQQTISANNNTFNALSSTNASVAGVIFDQAFTTATLLNTTVNSKLTFQHNTTFTITDALTLNGSSGNEIVLNSVDGANRFTLNCTGGAQTVSFVNVANSQASTNSITANNSINSGNTDSAESAPRWIFATPADLLISTGRFTLTSGTGNLAVTGVGFQPAAYILFLTKNAVDDTNSDEGTGNGSLFSIGMTDGTRQFCMASGVEDEQSNSDVGRRAFSDEVICNIDVSDENQSVLGEANHVSFDADGFTINRTVTFSNPTSVLVEYVAFGGGDLGVRVDTVDLNDTQDATVDVSDVAFEPDVVLTSFISNFIDANGNTNNDDDSISLGWQVNPAVQSINNQYSIMKASRDGQTTSASVTRFDDTRAGTAYRDGSIDAGFEINTFDAGGFSVQTRLAAAATNELMGYMALDLGPDPQVYSRARTAKTTAGDDVEVGAGFQPIFLMGIGSGVATTANTDTAGGSMVVGISDGTDTFTMLVHDEDGAGTSNTHSRTTNTQFMSAYGNDGTIDWESTLTSFDSSGWTINYGNAATSAYQNAFLAIGTSPAAVTITGTVYVDEGVTSIGAGKKVTLSINGDVAAQTVATDASGNYQFSAPTLAGDVITIFIDDETENAVTVTVSSGGLLNNIHLYKDRLVVRHDNGGSLANAELAIADNSGDADISAIYTMTGNQLTVPNSVELFIPSGNTFAPGDIINLDDIEIAGVFTPATVQTTTVTGTFDVGGGTITTTGTIFFSATSGTIQVTSNGQAVNNVIFDDGGGGTTWQFTDAFDVNGFLQLDNGTLDFVTNDAPAFIEGDVTLNNGSFLPGVTGTITFDGDKTFFDGTMSNMGTLVIDPDTTLGSDLSCSSLSINSGDTLTTDGYEIDCGNDITVEGILDARPGTDGNTTINVGRVWDSGSGLLMTLSSTLIMDDTAGANEFTSGSNTFYNLTFDDGDGGGNVTWELQDDLAVDGTLSIIEGVLDVTTNNRNITVNGNWFNSDTFTERSGTVTVAGTMAQTITTCSACSSGDFNNLVVTNNTAAVAFEDSFSVVNFTASSADTSLTFESSTTVTVSGNLTLDGGAVGDEVIINSGDGSTRFTFNVTGGNQTVYYVNVSNSQSSTNNITARNSTEGANTDSGEAAPHWIFANVLTGAVMIVD